LHVLKRRDPSLPVIIYPTAVQGDDAPGQIVRAIELANARQECDVLIVGRGGGSLEDLWSFNDERVARAIFASLIPVVSAVGHETDVTIADFVADLARRRRPRRRKWSAATSWSCCVRSRAASSVWRWRWTTTSPTGPGALPSFITVYSSTAAALARQQTVLERLRQRMNVAVDTQIKRAVSRQQRVTQRLNQQNPQPKIYRAQTRIQQLEYRLAETLRARLSATRERFGNAVTHLEAVSPLSTLARGYSVTTATDGKVLKQTKQVNTGDVLTTRLSDGWVESEVKSIKPVKKTRQRKTG
jgi:exodeoxyribonuclease VII large subunit